MNYIGIILLLVLVVCCVGVATLFVNEDRRCRELMDRGKGK